jgi:hypothetical protein
MIRRGCTTILLEKWGFFAGVRIKMPANRAFAGSQARKMAFSAIF